MLLVGTKEHSCLEVKIYAAVVIWNMASPAYLLVVGTQGYDLCRGGYMLSLAGTHWTCTINTRPRTVEASAARACVVYRAEWSSDFSILRPTESCEHNQRSSRESHERLSSTIAQPMQ